VLLLQETIAWLRHNMAHNDAINAIRIQTLESFINQMAAEQLAKQRAPTTKPSVVVEVLE
jgi:hypothetical protein